jgi:hypothetical protein
MLAIIAPRTSERQKVASGTLEDDLTVAIRGIAQNPLWAFFN